VRDVLELTAAVEETPNDVVKGLGGNCAVIVVLGEGFNVPGMEMVNNGLLEVGIGEGREVGYENGPAMDVGESADGDQGRFDI